MKSPNLSVPRTPYSSPTRSVSSQSSRRSPTKHCVFILIEPEFSRYTSHSVFLPSQTSSIWPTLAASTTGNASALLSNLAAPALRRPPLTTWASSPPRRLLRSSRPWRTHLFIQIYCKSEVRYSTMSATTANAGGDDEIRPRSQQSPLASQRAKEGDTPTDANKTGKSGGYFPLGYKEAYSQWVCTLLS